MSKCVFLIELPFFFFNDTATTEIYTLSLHDALPICGGRSLRRRVGGLGQLWGALWVRQLQRAASAGAWWKGWGVDPDDGFTPLPRSRQPGGGRRGPPVGGLR